MEVDAMVYIYLPTYQINTLTFSLATLFFSNFLRIGTYLDTKYKKIPTD